MYKDEACWFRLFYVNWYRLSNTTTGNASGTIKALHQSAALYL